MTAGLLALLDEPEPELQQLALEQLDSVLGAFWPEISEHIVAMSVSLLLLRSVW